MAYQPIDLEITGREIVTIGTVMKLLGKKAFTHEIEREWLHSLQTLNQERRIQADQNKGV